MQLSNQHSPKNLCNQPDKDRLIFSLYKNAKAVKKIKDISFSQYLEIISDPATKEQTEKLRALNPQDYKTAKANVKCITGSGTTANNNRTIEKLNGLAVVDIDILPNEYANFNDLKTALGKDKFSFVTAFSLSGKGVYIMVKVPVENDFKEIYLSLKEYYFNTYGVTIDLLADTNRLRFISYDKEYILNEDSQVYTDTVQQVQQVQQVQPVDVEQTDSFYTGSTPADVFNNSGIEAVNLINDLMEEKGFAVTSGSAPTLYEYQRHGGTPKSLVCFYNSDVIKFHVFSPNAGLKKSEYNLYELFKEITETDDFQAQNELAVQGFGNFTQPAKVVQKSKENYSELMEYVLSKDIQLNTLTGVIELNQQPLTDFHLSQMLLESSILHNKNTSKEILLSVIDVLANSRKFHPFIDYVEKLKTIPATDFTDIDELDNFIECFKGSTPKRVMRVYLKRWLLGLFDLQLRNQMTKNVLIVAGAQGAAKTSLAKNILPSELKHYGKTTEFNANKMVDSKIALCSILVACFDEFEAIFFRSASLANFKNLTASYDIFERRPYRRNHEQMFRSSIIMATSNHLEILTDSTGNTRFLSIDVQSFDLQRYFKIDIDKVWRVIYDAYLAGETSNLTDSERELQTTENLKFEAIDPIAEMIQQNFERCESGFLSTTEVMQELERNTKHKISVNKVGAALQKLGHERIARKVNNSVKRGYQLKSIYFDID